ncbi:hypothetical protein ASD15_21625 [Massilia sp. Root351]|jgi:uncharacterized membrane protein (UPF0127 family)|uniref:DUF192 domain-containing protein n=1 Tax=Massilia sp. Root351 TaxID=1736522 RepID=UPI000708EB45|nr:DUF192 domain-containing protein [Massilia sp. Root351]KQV78423.1 hypothetical protein ASD15_21625 [Massilia sp. Root351]
MQTILRCAALLAAAAPAPASSQQPVQPPGSVQLSAGGHRISAELAATEEQRRQGLMHRDAMPANSGMLLVFDRAGAHCLWMKNTPLPLSVAFIGADGRIVNIENMRANTLDSHCSASGQPVRYALQMNVGWFRQRHITPGMKVEQLPAPR